MWSGCIQWNGFGMRQLDLAEALRSWGLTVYEEPGWRTRGQDLLRDIRGILLHHTAGPASGVDPSKRVVRDGRSGLAGPLAQLYLARDGTWVTIASGLANHAGLGGPWKNVPQNMGNYHLLGVEAESTGYGDWTPAQLEAYPRGVAALLADFGLGSDRAVAHKEWAPSRKIDPAGWPGDMGGFRSTVNYQMNAGPQGEDMTPEQDKRLKDIEVWIKHNTFGKEGSHYDGVAPNAAEGEKSGAGYVRGSLELLKGEIAELQQGQANMSSALTNVQAALQRLEQKHV